jgi:Family of unknown function (DUF6256)
MSSQLLRQDLIPILGSYVILMGVLAFGLRLQRRGRTPSAHETGVADPAAREPAAADPAAHEAAVAAPAAPAAATADPVGSAPTDAGGKAPSRVARRVRPGWPRFAVQVGGTVLGGYVLLMAVVVGYYYGVAKVAGQFLDSAVTGSALLLAVSLPVFAVRSWLTEWRRRRPGR